MSSPKWLRSWKSVFDDNDNEIENIASTPSSLMVSPLRVSPLRTFDDTYHTTVPLPTTEAIPPQTVSEEINNTALPPPLMVLPLQTVIPVDDADEDSISADVGPGARPIKRTPLPTTEAILPQIISGKINNTEPPPPLMVLPLQMVIPVGDADEDSISSDVDPGAGPIKRTPLPTTEAILPQIVSGEINNTEPPPPLMVLPLQMVIPVDDADEDSISAAVGPGAGPIKRTPPPPPLMVTPLRTIVPIDDANNDSIAADIVPSAGPIKRKRGRPKGSKNLKPTIKKPKTYYTDSKVVISCPAFDSGISNAERETGSQDLADSVLMRFDAVRRRLCQLKVAKSVLTTALTNCINLGVRTNTKKRIGPVPGIHVGDIFYFWGEMCLVGLHTQMVAGIDYLTIKDGATEGPLATSVVTSGHYNDETEDLETLIYTGQGGKDKNGQAIDQKLGRGNLALEASTRKGNEVRVIRGVEDPNNNKKKVYIYDGLYLVSDYWKVKGESGFEEFKFKMVRKPGQPSGYAIWKSSKNWRKCGLDNSRKGLVLTDLSYGAETLPIPLVNEIDENDKERPHDFNYISSSTCSSMMIVENHQSTGCSNCQGQLCEDHKCFCIQKNGGELPYHDRILICRRPMVYECGDMCPCPPECHNRVIQTGLKIHVEVFKTENCGWGLRSLEPIRAGTFICELVGMAKRRDEVEEDDEYLFDTARVYNQFRWNYEPELVGEDCWEQISEAYKLRWQMLFSSKEYGNVSRFMNHSCSSNVMWQPIEFENTHQPSVRIAFFAKKHIPPLTELRYDYGMSSKTEEVGEDGENIYRGKKICHCGSVKCRGSFG